MAKGGRRGSRGARHLALARSCSSPDFRAGQRGLQLLHSRLHELGVERPSHGKADRHPAHGRSGRGGLCSKGGSGWGWGKAGREAAQRSRHGHR